MGHKKTIRGSGKKQHLKKAFAAEENEDKQALKKDVLENHINRKKEESKTQLFIKFTKQLPTKHSEITALHPDIKEVVTPRTIKKSAPNAGAFPYALVKFSSEDECVKAKEQLEKKGSKKFEMFVAFSGDKSKTKPVELHPSRLFISGFKMTVNSTMLKSLFPKCSTAWTKKKANFGFVQFVSPEDTKAAFDASQDLEIEGAKIRVLYAIHTQMKDDVIKRKKEKMLKKKAEKKAENREKRVAAKIKKNIPDEDVSSDDEDGEPPAKKTKEEDGSDDQNDDESGEENDNDSGDDDNESDDNDDGSGDDDNDDSGDDDDSDDD